MALSDWMRSPTSDITNKSLAFSEKQSSYWLSLIARCPLLNIASLERPLALQTLFRLRCMNITNKDRVMLSALIAFPRTYSNCCKSYLKVILKDYTEEILYFTVFLDLYVDILYSGIDLWNCVLKLQLLWNYIFAIELLKLINHGSNQWRGKFYERLLLFLHIYLYVDRKMINVQFEV